MAESQIPSSTASLSLTQQSQLPKPTHTIILDSSPLLLNTPPLSTLLANSNALVTTHSVISEIRDPDARSRVKTIYLPFVTLRSPRLESVAFVKQFAHKTGDGAVLSKTDIEVLALAYDIECERNDGDWRLRRVPGQKRLNGSPPKKDYVAEREAQADEEPARSEVAAVDAESELPQVVDVEGVKEDSGLVEITDETQHSVASSSPDVQDEVTVYKDQSPFVEELAQSDADVSLLPEELSSDSDSDSAGWITPSNIKKHQSRDNDASSSTKADATTLQVATITGDFAMQNVLLQMNLNLLSPATCKRIAHIKQTILRCHGCFVTTKDMAKQFCPRCGNPTLTRVSCTTNDRGEVKLHLKQNMQWNNKGNVFSIPKPVAGSANQKWKGPRQGGGRQGWGSDLILAEDQKEYVRAMSSQKRAVKKDLMDDDYLPSILTGDRNRGGGRVRVGAGRTVNRTKK